jgi:hypothetical protein
LQHTLAEQAVSCGNAPAKKNAKQTIEIWINFFIFIRDLIIPTLFQAFRKSPTNLGQSLRYKVKAFSKQIIGQSRPKSAKVGQSRPSYGGFGERTRNLELIFY